MVRNAVVLVSGGLDSTVLLHHVVKKMKLDKVYALNIYYGQRHSIEIGAAQYQCGELGVELDGIELTSVFKKYKGSALLDKNIRVPHVKEVLGHPQPITYVPWRNLTFLSVALGYAESRDANVVYYGAQLHDMYGYFDATQEFVDRVNKVVQLNRKHQMRIEAPLAHNFKSHNVKMGIDLKVNFARTWSCYDPQTSGQTANLHDPWTYTLACGTCPTCSERLKGFKEVGLTDPLPYKL